MKEIKPTSMSSTYASKKFSLSQSYSPDAKKPLLSVLSCLFSGFASLDLAVVLWTSRRKQKGFAAGKTPPQQQADQNREQEKRYK